MWIADQDFAPAPPIQRLLDEMVKVGDLGYPVRPWLNPLPGLFAERQAARHGWTPDPSRVRVLTDVLQAMEASLLLHGSPGDGVIVQTPIYPPFLEAVRTTRRELIENRLLAPPRRAAGDGSDAAGRRWEVDLDGFRAAAERARVFLLCNPHNPTGRVFTRAELEGMAEDRGRARPGRLRRRDPSGSALPWSSARAVREPRRRGGAAHRDVHLGHQVLEPRRALLRGGALRTRPAARLDRRFSTALFRPRLDRRHRGDRHRLARGRPLAGRAARLSRWQSRAARVVRPRSAAGHRSRRCPKRPSSPGSTVEPSTFPADRPPTSSSVRASPSPTVPTSAKPGAASCASTSRHRGRSSTRCSSAWLRRCADRPVSRRPFTARTTPRSNSIGRKNCVLRTPSRQGFEGASVCSSTRRSHELDYRQAAQDDERKSEVDGVDGGSRVDGDAGFRQRRGRGRRTTTRGTATRAACE